MQTVIETEEKPLGVIESLHQGFTFLNRHLWLILLPIFLDAFLWLGPRLSISSLIDNLFETLLAQPQLPAEFSLNFEAAMESMKSLGTEYNLFSLLAGVLTGFPSLFARLDFQSVATQSEKVISVTSWQSMLLWIAILIPLGILIGGFWLTLMVFAMRHERLMGRAFFSRWGWVWLNVNLYLLGLIAALIFASLVMGVIATLLIMGLGNAGVMLFSILWILFIGFSIWLSIGLFFVVIAIALDGVNLAQAVWRSLNVVGRNAVSTLGLLILTLLITEGFSRIWLQLSGQTWGLALGVVGNAYLGAALLASAILFYQSRYQHWQKSWALVMMNQHSDQNDKS